MVSDELIVWTREALAHLYNLAFLRRDAQAAYLKGQFDSPKDGSALQEALLRAIEQLKPPATVSLSSPAWRLYNILRLRYLEGLTQAEVANELHLSLRHIKREQERAVEAVAEWLLEGDEGDPSRTPEAGNQSEPASLGTLKPSRKVMPGPEALRIDELLRAALSVLDAVLQEQDLQLQVVVESPLPLVRADPMVARQLLISALGWMMHGIRSQTLAIHLGAEDRDMVLHLSKPQVYEPMHTGGELSTIQQLAEAIPAQVSLVTEAGLERQETALEIRMPVQMKSCVLMIDDDPDVIRLVQRYLQRSEEFYLVGVTQPEDALRHVATLGPACILLDLMMPSHDGWELLKLLRLSPAGAAIPVVVSSVLREPDLARTLGATDVLPRPFTAMQLTETLRAAIAKHRGTHEPQG